MSFPNLIINRSAEDVQRAAYLGSLSWDNMTPEERTEYLTPLKGAYNAEDLNRVTEAMEYLVEELAGYGYRVPYVPIEVHPGAPASYTVHNLLGQCDDIATRSANEPIYYNPEIYKTGSQSWIFIAPENAVEYTYQLRTSSTAYATPYLDPTHLYYFSAWLQQLTPSFGTGSFDFYWPIAEPVFMAGVKPDKPNEWCLVSKINHRSSFTAGNYPCRVDWNGAVKDLGMFFDGVRLVDLTADFGAGNEPDQAWCDENIPWAKDSVEIPAPGPYRWRREDIPTLAQLTQYLANVQAVRQTLSVAGDLPQTMRFLTWQGANEIERVLSEVEHRIQIMIQTFVPCGTATCGGDYL